MARLDHWEIALEQLIESRMNVPFEYGTHDCCLFAADCVQAISGIDVATDYRGLYNDFDSAKQIIQTVTGGTTTEDVVDDVCRKHEFMTQLQSVWFAQRGDVVSLVVDDHVSLGVVGLDGKNAWFTSDDELTRVNLSRCHRAWHIG